MTPTSMLLIWILLLGFLFSISIKAAVFVTFETHVFAYTIINTILLVKNDTR